MVSRHVHHRLVWKSLIIMESTAQAKKAVVIGRSLVVGKPAAMMLVKKNATVTICHTRTVDMPSVAREADIIIVAAGRAGVVGAEYVKRRPDNHRCRYQRKCRRQTLR